MLLLLSGPPICLHFYFCLCLHFALLFGACAFLHWLHRACPTELGRVQTDPVQCAWIFFNDLLTRNMKTQTVWWQIFSLKILRISSITLLIVTEKWNISEMCALEYKYFMPSFLYLRPVRRKEDTDNYLHKSVLKMGPSLYPACKYLHIWGACYSSEKLYELLWKQTIAETKTVAHCGEHGKAALVQSISTPPTATLVLHML